ncbi:Abi family protein [Hoeflea sp. YIM 152468]|uniref:Abi family protein n=1 Tax=Hoeflea sp. YIM 152468 TaxID=3031759 RepID=UPI0023DAF66D|nr:Abi family protein [Hoeflea sp. YIM 152468]MDF1610044.1 Abi family protein [Hoeflea sp. YIM 152468]
MALRPYTKPHRTPAQHAQHLEGCGLPLPGPTRQFAEKKIAQVGYERLRIYFLSRRQIKVPGKPFIPGTKFEDIIALYELDEELRLFSFLHLGRFEIALRNQLSEILSQRYSSHPYFDNSAYRTKKTRASAVGRISDIFYKKNDPRARHYFDEYNPPMIPPIWVMKEFMTFGNLSFMLEQLSTSMQNDLTTAFGMPNYKLLENWIKALNDLRNDCAHHGRLFNRSFQKELGHFKKAGVPAAPPNKLKALLECLEFLLKSQGYNDPIVASVATMLSRYPAVIPSEVGY